MRVRQRAQAALATHAERMKAVQEARARTEVAEARVLGLVSAAGANSGSADLANHADEIRAQMGQKKRPSEHEPLLSVHEPLSLHPERLPSEHERLLSTYSASARQARTKAAQQAACDFATPRQPASAAATPAARGGASATPRASAARLPAPSFTSAEATARSVRHPTRAAGSAGRTAAGGRTVEREAQREGRREGHGERQRCDTTCNKGSANRLAAAVSPLRAAVAAPLQALVTPAHASADDGFRRLVAHTVCARLQPLLPCVGGREGTAEAVHALTFCVPANCKGVPLQPEPLRELELW